LRDIFIDSSNNHNKQLTVKYEFFKARIYLEIVKHRIAFHRLYACSYIFPFILLLIDTPIISALHTPHKSNLFAYHTSEVIPMAKQKNAKPKKLKEKPISPAYPAIDNDLARDNLENDIPEADLQDE